MFYAISHTTQTSEQAQCKPEFESIISYNMYSMFVTPSSTVHPGTRVAHLMVEGASPLYLASTAIQCIWISFAMAKRQQTSTACSHICYQHTATHRGIVCPERVAVSSLCF